jgi:hypothetical protein
MFRKLKEEEVAILYIINNLDERGFNYFILDKDYSNFPSEQEVLLSSGIVFDI